MKLPPSHIFSKAWETIGRKFPAREVLRKSWRVIKPPEVREYKTVLDDLDSGFQALVPVFVSGTCWISDSNR